MKSFGDVVRELRERRGFSLRQLEAATGVSNSYLSQIESGRVGAPSAKIIEKLAAALDESYARLMTVAGYLTLSPPSAQVLQLSGETVSLDGLSDDQQQELLRFIQQLQDNRSRNATQGTHSSLQPSEVTYGDTAGSRR